MSTLSFYFSKYDNFRNFRIYSYIIYNFFLNLFIGNVSTRYICSTVLLFFYKVYNLIINYYNTYNNITLIVRNILIGFLSSIVKEIFPCRLFYYSLLYIYIFKSYKIIKFNMD